MKGKTELSEALKDSIYKQSVLREEVGMPKGAKEDAAHALFWKAIHDVKVDSKSDKVKERLKILVDAHIEWKKATKRAKNNKKMFDEAQLHQRIFLLSYESKVNKNEFKGRDAYYEVGELNLNSTK